MTVNGMLSIILEMAVESKSGQMVPFTKDTGEMIKPTAGVD